MLFILGTLIVSSFYLQNIRKLIKHFDQYEISIMVILNKRTEKNVINIHENQELYCINFYV